MDMSYAPTRSTPALSAYNGFLVIRRSYIYAARLTFFPTQRQRISKTGNCLTRLTRHLSDASDVSDVPDRDLTDLVVRVRSNPRQTRQTRQLSYSLCRSPRNRARPIYFLMSCMIPKVR